MGIKIKIKKKIRVKLIFFLFKDEIEKKMTKEKKIKRMRT